MSRRLEQRVFFLVAILEFVTVGSKIQTIYILLNQCNVVILSIAPPFLVTFPCALCLSNIYYVAVVTIYHIHVRDIVC